MDGRRPTGIMIANTDVDDPAKEDEYHRWYRDVHFPDLVEGGIFVNAQMFHNAQSPRPEEVGKFGAFYECYWDDVHAAALAFSKTVEMLFAEHRIHAGTVHRFFAIYRTLGIHFATRRRRFTQSLIAVHIDAGDPSQTEELREWYVRKHVPETVEVGLCHTGSFHERVDAEPFANVVASDQPRFLALYESDIGDPVAIAGMLAEHHPPERLPDFAKLRSASMFHRSGP